MWNQVEYTSEVPPASGCYAIYCSGLIAYIGHSKNIKRRIFQHLSANQFRGMTIKILLNGSKYHEGRLINRIKPALNLRVSSDSFEMKYKHTGLKNRRAIQFSPVRAIWQNTNGIITCTNSEESFRKEKAGAQYRKPQK
jgi:hypothetical protein